MPDNKGGRRMTTVSVMGNRQYTQTLATFAKICGVEVGELVRQALDEKYGDKLAIINTMTGSVHNETSATN